MLRVIAAILLITTVAVADPFPLPAGGRVNLPYNVNIGDNQWIIQRGGWLQQQGNMPVFGQAGNITVNGQGPQGNFNTATIDKQTGEIVCEGMQVAGLTLTRRILFNPEEGYCRYIDIFANRGAAAVSAAVMMQTSLNFGVNAGNLVNDPKKDSQVIAWVAQTGAGPSVLEMWAGPGTKLAPEVNWQQGNSFVQATFKLDVEPNGRAAIVHLHAIHGTTEAAEQYVATFKESKLLKGVPSDIRKAIVNFRTGGMMLGERELLRGEALDVIELRTGDQLRGTISAKSYQVQTSFGDVDVPAEKVIGVLTAGSFRPRQLIVTADGEIVGGSLKTESIELELSSGQKTAVPLSQISRIGYRKRPGESDEIAFTKPMVVLRTGDRLAFFPPGEPIDLLTRFGKVSLPLAKFSAIDLSGTETAAHVATLTDGSRFGGLLQTEQLQLKLATTGQSIALPVGSISTILMSPEQPDPSPTSPTLTLAGGDVLVAEMTGQLKLDTAFDTLTLNADEIVAVSPLKESGFDVQITLWDQTTVSGQLRDAVLTCTLAGDVRLGVPLALLDRYAQPAPRPSSAVVTQIRAIVAELSAEDFKLREAAEAKLVEMGEIVLPIVKELRDSQPLEAQQRIDSVIKKVGKK